HIALDGTLDAPAWQRAPVFTDFVEREPRNGAPPRYPTRVRVLTGAHALYVGVEALDPQPALIRAPLVRHDGVVRTQDFVALYLDPIGRGKVAQWFRVNAAGSTADGVHTGDDDNEDFSPDFDFDAAAARTPQGYTAVFRIPYATLRAASGERAPWRIMVVRRIPRDNNVLEASVPLPPELPSFIANMQPLRGAPAEANAPFLQLRPTLTLRRTLDQPPGAPSTASTPASAGLDVKWRPRADWVIDATLKPDFSQVALDVPQLSRNTRFALSLTEKRPFFLESSDLLRSPTDALYTRSITLPDWGVRASLRGEQLAGTVFALRDKGGGLVLLPGPYATGFADQPAAQVAVARLRWDGSARDGALTLGGLASLRRYEAGAGDNRVAGPDFTWQASEHLKLRGQWLLSQTSAQPDANGVLAAGPVVAGARRYINAFWRSEHVEAALTYDDIGAGFRDDNGFVVQNGVRTLDANYNRIWRNLGPLNELWVYLWGEAVRDRAGGQLVSSYLTPGVYAAYTRGSEATVEYRGASHVRVAPDAALLAERYWHFEYLTTPAPWAPQLSMKLDVGRLADVVAGAVRPGRRITLGAKLRPLPRLEVEPSFSQAQLAQGTQRNYNEVAAQLLAVWHFDAQRSLRLIAQRATVDRRAEPPLMVDALQLGSRASSLTYAWRRSAGTVLYA
ncbi:MAG: carbohydrate binding family 9 domain-containing protein, partial [Betaproteobacteria bacterium]|nr:carbohydrate binding family 9 domain-containing protein [Betaproteobacteria bacterium]